MSIDSQLPLVSVLVPLFNHAAFIGSCLDSLSNEGYPKLQVIVVDDGSSDGSFDVATKWRDEHRPEFQDFQLLQQRNLGLARSLNRMIGCAEGEFVAILASDDLLLSGGIEARVRCIQRHPQWLAVFGDCTIIDRNGGTIAESGLRHSPNGNPLLRANKAALSNPALISEELLLRWSVPGPVLLLRRSAYDPVTGVGPYDEALGITDRDLYLRLLARGAIGFLDRRVAAYRLHDDNTIRRRSFAPRLARAISAAESKNARSFTGAKHAILRLGAFKSANYAALRERPTAARWALAIALHLVFRLACVIHDARVAACAKRGRA